MAKNLAREQILLAQSRDWKVEGGIFVYTVAGLASAIGGAADGGNFGKESTGNYSGIV